MKKMVVCLGFILLISINTYENEYTMVVYDSQQKPQTHPFGIDDLTLLAFMKQESNFNPNAINPVSGARGALQILPIMIGEANRLQKLYLYNFEVVYTGANSYTFEPVQYTWEDAWCVEKSIEIWYIVQRHHNPNYDLELACQIWFGKGVQYDGMTWREYHIGIEQHLSHLTE